MRVKYHVSFFPFFSLVSAFTPSNRITVQYKQLCIVCTNHPTEIPSWASRATTILSPDRSYRYSSSTRLSVFDRIIDAFQSLSGIGGATTISSSSNSSSNSSSSTNHRANNKVLTTVQRQQQQQQQPQQPPQQHIVDYSVLDFPGPEVAHAAQMKHILRSSVKYPHLLVATFAGGCFWGIELLYQRIVGVEYTVTGYVQGYESFPTYAQVCSGSTNYTEGVIVYYDPTIVSYEYLVDAFFRHVDPTIVNGQGNDYGKHYRTGIYYHSIEQLHIAQKRLTQETEKYQNKKPIATELQPVQFFWPAEKFHQQYLQKGGRFGQPQDASKGSTIPIRCYG
jgi:peptide-methionine (S)-S-oxide reductase